MITGILICAGLLAYLSILIYLVARPAPVPSRRIRRRLAALDAVRRHVADYPGCTPEHVTAATGMHWKRVYAALVTLSGNGHAVWRRDRFGAVGYTLTGPGYFPLENILERQP